MPVEHGTASRYAQEMRRWNAHHSEFGPPGRPYVFQEFPKLLSRADRVDGVVKIVETRRVGDEDEELKANGLGFRFSQQDALDLIKHEQTVHGTLAAEREYEIRHGRLSEKAVEEVRAVEEAAGAVHVPVIPEGPKRKRGRPRTTAA
jgi:hypothetical protein